MEGIPLGYPLTLTELRKRFSEPKKKPDSTWTLKRTESGAIYGLDLAAADESSSYRVVEGVWDDRGVFHFTAEYQQTPVAWEETT